MFEHFLGRKNKNKKENGPLAEKQDRKSKRTRQKNKIGNRKGESNDNHEIPAKGETDIPGLPLG